MSDRTAAISVSETASRDGDAIISASFSALDKEENSGGAATHILTDIHQFGANPFINPESIRCRRRRAFTR
jgi:hypothetical protein